eukprot:symbB.v1.2.025428.t2/scaffold2465.1/size78641/4
MVLLDGAHNPHAAQELAAYIDHAVRPQAVRWVVALSLGKDAKGILKQLLRDKDLAEVGWINSHSRCVLTIWSTWHASYWSNTTSSQSMRQSRLRGAVGGPQHEASQDTEEVPFLQKAWALSLVAAVCVAFVGPQVELGQAKFGPAPAVALTSGSGRRVNKDPVSLLQYALPLEELCGADKVKPIRELQADIEEARLFVTQRIFDKARGGVTNALKKIAERKKDLLKPVSDANKPAVEEKLATLGAALDQALQEIGGAEYGGTGTPYQADMVEKCLKSFDKAQETVGSAEELLLPPGYAAKVPCKWSDIHELTL